MGKKARSLPAVATSLAVHVGLLGAALAATVATPPAPRPQPIIELYPPEPREPAPPESGRRAPQPPVPALEPPRPGEFTLPLSSFEVPDGIPPIDPVTSRLPLFDPSRQREIRWVVPGKGRGAGPGDGGPFLAESVEQPPAVIWSPPVAYPPMLRQAGIAGTVVIEVVVDSSGRADRRTLEVISASHAGFVPAARDVVLGTRYRAARDRGRPVPVLVRYPVVFEIRNAGAR
jgi:protein TonB